MHDPIFRRSARSSLDCQGLYGAINEAYMPHKLSWPLGRTFWGRPNIRWPFWCWSDGWTWISTLQSTVKKFTRRKNGCMGNYGTGTRTFFTGNLEFPARNGLVVSLRKLPICKISPNTCNFQRAILKWFILNYICD